MFDSEYFTFLLTMCVKEEKAARQLTLFASNIICQHSYMKNHFHKRKNPAIWNQNLICYYKFSYSQETGNLAL